MIPVQHPLSKTATELRRSINRLHVFKEQNPNEPVVQSGRIDSIIKELKEARAYIPAEYKDVDLKD